MTNKNLLYIIGNYSQYSVMTYMRKELKSGDIYIYKIIFAVQQKYNIVNQLTPIKIFKK